MFTEKLGTKEHQEEGPSLLGPARAGLMLANECFSLCHTLSFVIAKVSVLLLFTFYDTK